MCGCVCVFLYDYDVIVTADRALPLVLLGSWNSSQWSKQRDSSPPGQHYGTVHADSVNRRINVILVFSKKEDTPEHHPGTEWSCVCVCP